MRFHLPTVVNEPRFFCVRGYNWRVTKVGADLFEVRKNLDHVGEPLVGDAAKTSATIQALFGKR